MAKRSYCIPVTVLVVLLLWCGRWAYPYEQTSLPWQPTPDEVTQDQTDSVVQGEDQGGGERVAEDMMPNIIFAMADDLGWGDVQYNNGVASTPNLNAMAKSQNSILLQRHYSGAPVCSPTRGTVLTGRNHNRYCLWYANSGVYSKDFTKPETMPLPLSEISVAEVMRKAGYATALFGKWHMGDFKKVDGGNKQWPVSHPGQHGFEQWQATERSGPTVTFNCGCFKKDMCYMGHAVTPYPCLNYYTSRSAGIVPWPDPISGDDSHFIWSLGEKFVREQVKLKKPFFLYLPFHTVHKPFVATEHYREVYLNMNYSLEQADYYGSISALDEVIGKIRQLLRDLSIRENTILWFTSDNGPELNTPGSINGLRGHKARLYEGGIRVPGIIEWPNVIKHNRVSSFPIVTNDLLPTVYDILGVKPSDDRPLDGISILPLLQGKVSHRNHSIFWAFNLQPGYNSSHKVVASGDQYKLVVNYKNRKMHNYELYDLLHDIGETKNIKNQFPCLCKKLLGEVEEWRASVMNSAAEIHCRSL